MAQSKSRLYYFPLLSAPTRGPRRPAGLLCRPANLARPLRGEIVIYQLVILAAKNALEASSCGLEWIFGILVRDGELDG